MLFIKLKLKEKFELVLAEHKRILMVINVLVVVKKNNSFCHFVNYGWRKQDVKKKKKTSMVQNILLKNFSNNKVGDIFAFCNNI